MAMSKGGSKDPWEARGWGREKLPEIASEPGGMKTQAHLRGRQPGESQSGGTPLD